MPKPIKLRITRDAERQIRGGHPWVFAKSVVECNDPTGDPGLAVVYGRDNEFLAVGFFDPMSPIRFRVLQQGEPAIVDAAFWRGRLQAALDRRGTLIREKRTTGYRLIHGESDGWPGLVLDRYGDLLAVKIYSSAWLSWLDFLGGLFQEQMPWPVTGVIQRSSLSMGKTGVSRGIEVREHKPNSCWLRGAPGGGSVEFLENGLRFEADLVAGQKTGFFLDQRENRQAVGSMSRGFEVLNLFSYTGGFSVYAADGGARAVMDVDISEHALAGARRNIELNRSSPGVADCKHETLRADVFDWLETGERQRLWNLVVLDPPSLAKKEADRAAALGAYRRLFRLALARVRPGGVLVAASCSAHVTREDFLELVRNTAAASGRRYGVMRETAHPLDHPAGFKQAEYLKCTYLKLE